MVVDVVLAADLAVGRDIDADGHLFGNDLMDGPVDLFTVAVAQDAVDDVGGRPPCAIEAGRHGGMWRLRVRPDRRGQQWHVARRG